MLMLYFLLFCMLLIALGLIAVALRPVSLRFITVSVLFLLSALGIYYLIQPAGLKNWLGGGAEHYQLLVQFQQLGGVKGAIASITARLTNDPENVEGWLLLGKLYLADHNDAAAEAAFARARALQQKTSR